MMVGASVAGIALALTVAVLTNGGSGHGHRHISLVTHAGTPSPVGSLPDVLRRVALHRIYFGHQSVGANVLDGVRELARESGVTELRIVPVAAGTQPVGGVLLEGPIGKNGVPEAKCEDFSRILRGMKESPPEVAIMKFCYVDIDELTNVERVFALYKSTIEGLRQQLSGTQLVHVTVPLTTREAWWRRMIKRVLGRDVSDRAHLNRARFNRKLHDAFPNDPIYDLARVESTLPDGSRTSFTMEGEEAYALAEEYTEDGGHLNSIGRKRAADEFLRVLSVLLTD